MQAKVTKFLQLVPGASTFCLRYHLFRPCGLLALVLDRKSNKRVIPPSIRFWINWPKYGFATRRRGLAFVSGISLGEGVASLRPRIPVARGKVRQKCAGNALRARSGILGRPAPGELRCRLLTTSSTRAPEATPN